jgi:hypothetical protein
MTDRTHHHHRSRLVTRLAMHVVVASAAGHLHLRGKLRTSPDACASPVASSTCMHAPSARNSPAACTSAESNSAESSAWKAGTFRAQPSSHAMIHRIPHAGARGGHGGHGGRGGHCVRVDQRGLMASARFGRVPAAAGVYVRVDWPASRSGRQRLRRERGAGLHPCRPGPALRR